MSDPITIKAPFVGNDGRPLVEPGAFYLDGNYALRVNSWNALAGVVITIRARMIRASDGEIVDSSWDHTPNTNRTKATNDFPLPQGFILNITAFASAGAPLIGQTFVQVQLARGLTGATLLLATMLQDYVTAVQALAYPGSPIRSSIDGGGVTRMITGTTPGAGVEISETVPTGARWRLQAFTANLSAAAGGSARNPSLWLIVSTSKFAVGLPTNTLAAGTGGLFSWGPGQTQSKDAVPQWFTAPTPIGLTMLGGASLQTITDFLAGADQWSLVNYIVSEYIEAAS